VLHTGQFVFRKGSLSDVCFGSGCQGSILLVGWCIFVNCRKPPLFDTPFVGKQLRQTQLREKLGINIVGIWEAVKFLGSHPGYHS